MSFAPGLLRLFRWLRRRPAGLYAAVVACAAYLVATTYYSDRLHANFDWKSRVIEERETRLIGGVFEMAGDLIRLRRESGSGRFLIDAPDCEDAMLQRDSEEERRHAGALKLLCQSPQGAQVLAEIAAWNGSYNFVAVRDDRSQKETCDNATSAPDGAARNAGYVVPRGCKRNAWTAEIESGGDGVPVPWRSAGEPPLEEFAFLVDPADPIPYQGDWALLSPPARDSVADYRLQTKLPLAHGSAPHDVTIEAVGRLTGISIDGAPMETVSSVDPSKPETHRIGDVKADVYFDCNSHERNEIEPVESDTTAVDALAAVPPECPSLVAGDLKSRDRRKAGHGVNLRHPHQQLARAQFVYQVRLTFPPNAQDRTATVALRIESEPTIPESLRQKPGAAASAPLDNFGRGARNLRVRCEPGWRAPGAWAQKCDLFWKRLEEGERAPPFRVVVGCENNLAEDVFDLDTGLIKRDFFDLGFASFAGYSKNDWGSLAWALSQATKSRRAAEPCDSLPALKPAPGAAQPAKGPVTVVPLTIDPKLQRVALNALANEEKKLPKCGARRPGRARAAEVNTDALAKCARASRQAAALVVLDDDAAPGAIRALASWPPTPDHLSEWDLRALETADTTFAGFGWRAVGQDNVPGSTFKAVTATAAVTALVAPGLFTGQEEDKAALARLLRGEATRPQTEAFLGLKKAPFKSVGKPPRRHWIDDKGDAERYCAPDLVAKGAPAADTIPIYADKTHPLYCPHNDNWDPFFDPAAPKTHCPGNHGAEGHMGMCEAVIVSSNLYFGGVGHRLIDLVRPKAPVAELFPAPAMENFLEATARRLSFGLDVFAKPDDCGSGGSAPWRRPASTSAAFDLTRGVAPAPRLEANPVTILANHPGCETTSKKEPQLQAGFGLSVTATPMAMASIYASVGRQTLVRPSLVVVPRGGDGCPVDKADGECDPLIPAGGDGADYYNILREGFHGVAGPQGTARGLGAEQASLEAGGAERLFVKTGTATVGSVGGKDRLSLWVAGWVEGRAATTGGRQRPIAKRRAFACVVTNQATGYGGSVCGPVIDELLKHLGEEGSLR